VGRSLSRWTVVVLAAAIPLTVATAPAAAVPKIPSELAFTSYDPPPSYTFHGEVSTDSGKCVGKRKVVFSDDGTPLTTKTTKKDGSFTVTLFELAAPGVEDGFIGTVKKAKIGKRHKRKVCTADSAEVRVETHETTFGNVDLHPNSHFVVGSLSSDLPECTAGRGIDLYVDDGDGGGPTFVQGDVTANDGTFTLGNPTEAGAWDVRVGADADIAVPQFNGDFVFATCKAPNPTDSDDITVVKDNPSLSINYDGSTPEFYGNLSSDVPGCLADRTVDLYDGNTFKGSSGVNPGNGLWVVEAGFADTGNVWTAEINDVTVIGDSQPYTVCTDVQSGGLGPF
jgi:hypothetical protein